MLAVCYCVVLTAWMALAPTSTGELRGRVIDDTAAAIPGVPIVLELHGGESRETTSDSSGEYVFQSLPAGRHRVIARLVNFAEVRRDVVIADRPTRADLVLRPALSAHVVVTGHRTFRNLAEVPRPEESLIGLASSAAMGAVTSRQLEARPAMRGGELLESVPGMIVTQHSGEGKANQYHLRGFNLDHGTDFATTVAGVPVNMPTHAHGHGYSDLSFLIPELVSGVQYKKGPYFADEGDFSAAGAASINYVAQLDAPVIRASLGELGWQRLLYAASPGVGGGRLLFAGELTRHDGPWERPDGYQRVNGVLRYSHGDSRRGTSFTVMGYRGQWHSTDQVPERAVRSGVIGRFGTLDPSDGGASYRYSLAAEVQRGSATTSTHGSAYVLGYGLGLFSNFTYVLDDPEQGDQFEQRDARVVSGGRLVHRRLASWSGRAVENAFGVAVRHDAIGIVGLYRTQARRRHGIVREDSVGQTSFGAFAENETVWFPRLRTVLGLRADLFRFDVDSDTMLNSGRAAAGALSPKASLIAGPWAATEIYVNAGRGFHSNDARGAAIRIDPVTGASAERVTPVAAASGAEVGVRTVAIPRVQLTASLWTLGLESELLFVGDAGSTAAGRPSRRAGLELSAYATLGSRVHFDVDMAVSRARFTDPSPEGEHVPGAARFVASAGTSVKAWRGITVGLRWRHLGARPLTSDDQVRSRSSSTVSTRVGYAIAPRVQLGVEVFNLLGASVSDIDYFYVSRLPGEPLEGIADRHTHPMPPRTLRAGLSVTF